MSGSHSAKILPVVVLYKTQLEEQAAYKTLLNSREWDEFVVYDNSPEEYLHCEITDKRAIYIRDVHNGGLPKAYNTALKIAEKNGYEWLLLLDQDTVFGNEITRDYISSVESCNDIDIIAPRLITFSDKPFSPCKLNLFTGKSIVPNLHSGKEKLSKATPVNSGTCIRVSLLNSIGGYDERRKLDFVDYSLYDRLLSRNRDEKFYLMNAMAIQNFSNEQNSTEALLNRFRIFIHDGKCNFKYIIVIIRHTLALMVKAKKISFIIDLLKIYF